MSLADFLQKRRAELDNTQGEIAQRGGLERSYISLVERGFILQPAPGKLVRLAKAYKVEPEELLAMTSAGYRHRAPGELPEPEDYFRTRYEVDEVFAHHLADVCDTLVLVHRRHAKAPEESSELDTPGQLRTMVLASASPLAIAYCS